MHLEILTVDGRTIKRKETNDVSNEEVEAAKELFMDWPRMNYVTVEYDGKVSFINPSNVVEVRFVL